MSRSNKGLLCCSSNHCSISSNGQVVSFCIEQLDNKTKKSKIKGINLFMSFNLFIPSKLNFD